MLPDLANNDGDANMSEVITDVLLSEYEGIIASVGENATDERSSRRSCGMGTGLNTGLGSLSDSPGSTAPASSATRSRLPRRWTLKTAQPDCDRF